MFFMLGSVQHENTVAQKNEQAIIVSLKLFNLNELVYDMDFLYFL